MKKKKLYFRVIFNARYILILRSRSINSNKFDISRVPYSLILSLMEYKIIKNNKTIF